MDHSSLVFLLLLLQLHVAAANGYVDVLEFLLNQEDVDIHVKDKEGWTPFHVGVFWEEVSNRLCTCSFCSATVITTLIACTES